jgi:uncharacterized protein (DUF486 family)
MTFAWYGNIGFHKLTSQNTSLLLLILLSWGVAFLEYCFMVPANRIGFIDNGGPFNIYELKTIQEAISLLVFMIINVYIFKGETPQWNHLVGFGLMVLAVFVIFKKW